MKHDVQHYAHCQETSVFKPVLTDLVASRQHQHIIASTVSYFYIWQLRSNMIIQVESCLSPVFSLR